MIIVQGQPLNESRRMYTYIHLYIHVFIFCLRTITGDIVISRLSFTPKSKYRGYTVLGKRLQAIKNHGYHDGGRRCVYNTSFSNEAFATASVK